MMSLAPDSVIGGWSRNQPWSLTARPRNHRMKRYEERLLEDMQSRRWKVLLSERPPIYDLPNELLLLIFGFIDHINTLCEVRNVSRRFAQLATTMMFKTIHMDSIKPSRMPLLAWVFSKNPPLLQAATAIHLRLCGLRLTWDFSLRSATTSDQDVAQAQVISAMPNLKSLSICLGHISSDVYPLSANTPRLGFSRTLKAISECPSLRELHLGEVSASYNDTAGFLLLDLFTSVGQRLEHLYLRNYIFNRVLNLVDPTDPMNDPRLPFPPAVFGNLTHLTLQFQYLSTPEFYKLSVMVSKHMPKLTSLECFTIQPKYIDDPVLTIPAMNPIKRLVIRQCYCFRRWMISVPTKRLEFRLLGNFQSVAIQELACFITSQEGVFGQRCVEDIQLIIIRFPPGYVERGCGAQWLYGAQNTTIGPTRPVVEDVVEEAAFKVLRKVCEKHKITLTTACVVLSDTEL